MVVAEVITALGFGGAERLLVNMANRMADDATVHIIYLKDEAKLKTELRPNVSLHYVPLGLHCASALRALIIKLKPDIVQTHLGHADLITLWATRGLNIKLMITLHNVHYKKGWRDWGIFAAYKLLLKFVQPNAMISAISENIAQHAQKKLGVAASRISLIPNGISSIQNAFSKDAARSKLGLQIGHNYALFVGRFAPQKNVAYLLQALALLPKGLDLVVLFVGEGELEPDLKALAGKLEIENRVEFRGTTLKPSDYMRAADFLVLPSVFEGLPTVVLEAMRECLPVVCSDIDGTSDLISHQQNGLLFPLNKEELLAKTLTYAVENPEVLSGLAQVAEANFRGSEHTIDAYVASTLRLIDRCRA